MIRLYSSDTTSHTLLHTHTHRLPLEFIQKGEYPIGLYGRRELKDYWNKIVPGAQTGIARRKELTYETLALRGIRAGRVKGLLAATLDSI